MGSFAHFLYTNSGREAIGVISHKLVLTITWMSVVSKGLAYSRSCQLSGIGKTVSSPLGSTQGDRMLDIDFNFFREKLATGVLSLVMYYGWEFDESMFSLSYEFCCCGFFIH